MEEQITSVEDFLRRIKAHTNLHSDDGGTQKPKILRLSPKLDLLQAEQQMFAEFKRANPLLIDPYRAIDEWDYLTLGQHFGLPTRLLDWSDNALTALWFATAPETQNDGRSSAVVWMLKTGAADFIDTAMQVWPFDVKETLFYRPRIIK